MNPGCPFFVAPSAGPARLQRRAFASLVAILVIPLVAAGQGSDRAGVYSEEGALEVQKAREVSVTSKGSKAFYTDIWDLSDLPEYRPERKVRGTIRMWGTNYLADSPLGKQWQTAFRKYHPGVAFTSLMKSPTTALPALYTGVSDLAFGKVTFESILAYQRVMNRDPLEVVILTGSFDVPGWNNSLAIFVHKDNPLEQITIEQLDAIFGAARTGGWLRTEYHPEFARGANRNIRTWGQMGLTGEWLNAPIQTYGVTQRYGQAWAFSDKVLQGGDKWNENYRGYANYARPDGTLAIGAAELMKDLAKDRFGIAFSGPQNDSADVKMLALAARGSDEYIRPSMQTVRDHTYPLYDQVYAYTNYDDQRRTDPKVREFLRFILSREGQELVMKDGKYLPLTGAMARAQLERLR